MRSAALYCPFALYLQGKLNIFYGAIIIYLELMLNRNVLVRLDGLIVTEFLFPRRGDQGSVLRRIR